MLYQTSGSRLFIANHPSEHPGYIPAGGWVEVGEVEAVGLLGVEWEMHDASHVNCNSNAQSETLIKGILRRSPMQIVMGNDPADAGQQIVWNAGRVTDHFPFRLLFPDGETSRTWTALVTSIGEVFDTANAVIKLQVTLIPSSQIYRSEGD